MSFIFRDWNAFILECLEILKSNQFSTDNSKRQEWINTSAEWKERVEDGVIEYMLGKAKSKQKKQYIKLLEIMLVNVLDKIYFDYEPDSCNNFILKSFSGHLQDFLIFLQSNFNDYFDYRQKMPAVISIESSKELLRLTESISQAALASSMDSSYIVQFIVKSFKELCCDHVVLTFSEMHYHLELANELLEAGILSEERLKRTLFNFNYNHKDLCELLGKQFMQAVRKQKTKSSRMLMLLLEQKKINQYPIKCDYYLHSYLPSLREQLNEWINDELNFMKADEFSPEDTNNNTFVHVPFRGTEIYLLHKAFIDSGGAAGETYKSLFEKTASHLINSNQKGFSIESLQKKADKVDYEAKDNAKRFLQKMIRNIDSY